MRNKGRFQFLCHQSCTQSALKLMFRRLKNQTLTSMPHFSKSCNGFTHYRSVTCWAGSLRCRRNTEIISIYHIVKHGIQRVLFTVSAILLLTFRGSFCFMNIFLKVWKDFIRIQFIRQRKYVLPFSKWSISWVVVRPVDSDDTDPVLVSLSSTFLTSTSIFSTLFSTTAFFFLVGFWGGATFWREGFEGASSKKWTVKNRLKRPVATFNSRRILNVLYWFHDWVQLIIGTEFWRFHLYPKKAILWGSTHHTVQVTLI